ncbi:MAG: DUF4397 domain-containing protein [Acidimicrobiia bacterium]|nr:DUF4397 domain-containing protein [Acidimicrobiia bacterium]
MKKFTSGLVGLLAVALLALPAGAQASGGMVSVIHGIPGLTVDVYVNDALTLEDFAPGDVAGPLELPAGDYSLAITAADDTVANAVLTGSATVTDGLDASIVAHLNGDGTPTISIFANDVSSIDAGEGRLTVRHTAAAPTVDILLADGTEVFTDVSNPQEGIVELPAATYSVAIAPANGGVAGAVFGPADLAVVEGTNRIVYATGDLAGGTFSLVIQDIGGLGTAPAAVPTGSGDLADVAPFAALIAIASALALFGSARLAIRRR